MVVIRIVSGVNHLVSRGLAPDGAIQFSKEASLSGVRPAVADVIRIVSV